MPDKDTNVQENETEFTQHRALINHAMKGEPAQMTPIFADLMADKIAGAIETRRAEIGANMFAATQEDE